MNYVLKGLPLDLDITEIAYALQILVVKIQHISKMRSLRHEKWLFPIFFTTVENDTNESLKRMRYIDNIRISIEEHKSKGFKQWYDN